MSTSDQPRRDRVTPRDISVVAGISMAHSSDTLKRLMEQVQQVDAVLGELPPLQKMAVQLAAELTTAELRGVLAGVAALRQER